MIPAGRLRHRIRLQQQAVAQDAAGSLIRTWSDVGTFWAECLPLSGREQVAVQAKGSKATWRIVMRWRADVSTTMRLLHDGRVLNITASVDLAGTRQWLHIEAEEVHVK